jgi:hypothetical protein
MTMGQIRSRRFLLAAGLLPLVFATGLPAQKAAAPRAERAPEILLSGDKVVLPIVMVREFPFVEGKISGVEGKLMLDTGADQALAINDHRVPLSTGHLSGTGHFGSGQTFQTRMNDVVPDIAFGTLRYPQATMVASQDATQLEHITPDFIGWLGYYFWQGYAMKLDYVRLEATFYKGGSEEYLAGEKVLAIIPFETGKLPNHPLVDARIGIVDLMAVFDTGQYGNLFIDEQTKVLLLEAASLSNKSDDDFDLKSLRIGDTSLPAIPKIHVSTSVFPAAEPIGISERNILTIGYGLLSQYKTVWDWKSRRIYFLAR